MKRRGRPQKSRPELDATDARGFGARTRAFLATQEAKGQSPETIDSRKKSLCIFIAWCLSAGVTRPQEVTRELLERYQRWLFAHRTDDGKPWSLRYQFSLMDAVRMFFSWAAKNNLVLFNPASEIELPRIERTLPKYVLNVDEVEKVMAQPDLASPAGLRDRAMLEVLYSTGIRRAELVALDIYDVQIDWGTVVVRQGKRRKDRTVPIGERALRWVRNYLDDGRPYLVHGPDCGALFLSSTGVRFNLDKVTLIIHKYVEGSGIGKKGSCHLFRHTAATLMLENGADVRFIQALLGHASITTTQIYTEVSIRKLKEVHDATHPGAKLKTPEPSEE